MSTVSAVLVWRTFQRQRVAWHKVNCFGVKDCSERWRVLSTVSAVLVWRILFSEVEGGMKHRQLFLEVEGGVHKCEGLCFQRQRIISQSQQSVWIAEDHSEASVIIDVLCQFCTADGFYPEIEIASPFVLQCKCSIGNSGVVTCRLWWHLFCSYFYGSSA